MYSHHIHSCYICCCCFVVCSDSDSLLVQILCYFFLKALTHTTTGAFWGIFNCVQNTCRVPNTFKPFFFLNLKFEFVFPMHTAPKNAHYTKNHTKNNAEESCV